MAKNRPSVSVVIPTTGRTSLLVAVKSAIGQTYKTNVIVVLDKPQLKDQVESLLQGLKVTLLMNSGEGAPAARNMGLLFSETEYVAFLDDDDYWLEQKIEFQMADLLACDSEKTFSVCQTIFMRNSRKQSRNTAVEFRSEQINFADYLLARKKLRFGNTFFCSSGLLISKEIAQANLWDESLKKHQDWDLFLRLVEEGGIQPVQTSNQLVVVNQGSVASISRLSSPIDSLNFFWKHLSKMNSRTASDFLLLHIYATLPMSKLFKRATINLPKLPGVPHAAAITRFVIGYLRHRLLSRFRNVES